MNVSKSISRIKRLFKPVSPTKSAVFIDDYDEDFQEYHNPWLGLSNLLSENQNKI